MRMLNEQLMACSGSERLLCDDASNMTIPRHIICIIQELRIVQSYHINAKFNCFHGVALIGWFLPMPPMAFRWSAQNSGDWLISAGKILARPIYDDLAYFAYFRESTAASVHRLGWSGARPRPYHKIRYNLHGHANVVPCTNENGFMCECEPK